MNLRKCRQTETFGTVLEYLRLDLLTKNPIMKNIALTVLMMLFVGVGSSMAQDKKAADSDTKAKTEVTAEKKHNCSASEKKACCAKKGASASADKKSCAPGCEKACCTADAGKATKEEHDHSSHEGHNHPH